MRMKRAIRCLVLHAHKRLSKVLLVWVRFHFSAFSRTHVFYSNLFFSVSPQGFLWGIAVLRVLDDIASEPTTSISSLTMASEKVVENDETVYAKGPRVWYVFIRVQICLSRFDYVNIVELSFAQVLSGR